MLAAALLHATHVVAATHTVTIHRMTYEVPQATLRIGDVVEWVNRDSVPHTATSTNGGFDAVLAAGETVRTTLTRAGRFEVTCKYHLGMRAELSVE